MSELKITGYADSVSSLPDNPSDAGYTPAELKRIFDSRTDNEVKDKHNKTVDALIALDETVTDIIGRVEECREKQAQMGSALENTVTKTEFSALVGDITSVLDQTLEVGESMLKEE